jgi:hypothetical protein
MNKKVEYPDTQEDITNYKDNKKIAIFLRLKTSF